MSTRDCVPIVACPTGAPFVFASLHQLASLTVFDIDRRPRMAQVRCLTADLCTPGAPWVHPVTLKRRRASKEEGGITGIRV
jgi:hypothetical protein